MNERMEKGNQEENCSQNTSANETENIVLRCICVEKTTNTFEMKKIITISEKSVNTLEYVQKKNNH